MFVGKLLMKFVVCQEYLDAFSYFDQDMHPVGYDFTEDIEIAGLNQTFLKQILRSVLPDHDPWEWIPPTKDTYTEEDWQDILIILNWLGSEYTEWIRSSLGYKSWFKGYTKQSIERIAKNNCLPILIWRDPMGKEFVRRHWDGKPKMYPAEKEITHMAAEYGRLSILKYCNEKKFRFGGGAMDNAARQGHLEIVKWLHENRSEGCTTWAIDMAAYNGHLEVVKWLHENRTEGCTTDAMDHAAWMGHLEVVKFLHENRTEGCTDFAMDNAAEEGHLEIVKYLHENRTEGCTSKAMDEAAAFGELEIVKFLHENRTEGCTSYAMDRAAGNGHLDVVKWLHENRTEGYTTDAMDRAAREGHLDVVDYLNEFIDEDDDEYEE